MYFLFHLFTGIIIGFLVSDLMHDRRWLIPCAVGAILPDLIDKTLGHILFPVSIGYGRIYSHTLLVVLLILVIGVAIWKMKKDPGVTAVGVGILSHQVLDQMWGEPVNWYYPILGPFRGMAPENFLWIGLGEELNNPFELILAVLVCIFILVLIYRDKIAFFIDRNRPVISSVMTFSALLLCSLSGIIIGWGVARHKLPEIGWGTPGDLIIGGMVIGLAACLVWRWQNIISRE